METVVRSKKGKAPGEDVEPHERSRCRAGTGAGRYMTGRISKEQWHRADANSRGEDVG